MKILFTCGGTAGHVNPAVALAQLFQARNPGCQVLFVGADGGMETRLVPKEGYEIQTVTITNFRRSMAPAAIGHNVKTLLNMNKSKKQADAILDQFQPDLVVGTGGYASFPVVSAAARRGIPTAVHESNAVPGLTTKALSKVVDVVMVGFEESRSHYDTPEKVVVTGTPVRGDFFRYTRKEARAKLGFADDRPLVLSVWGSLGAEVMNRQIAQCIALECRDGAPFRHIHGAGRDYQSVVEVLRDSGVEKFPDIDIREYIYGGAGALPQRGGRPPDQERPGALQRRRGGAPAGERVQRGEAVQPHHQAAGRRPPAGEHEPRPAGHGRARRGGADLQNPDRPAGKTGWLNPPVPLRIGWRTKQNLRRLEP